MLMGVRILVTGGAGFIGSHLVDRLVRDRVGSVVVLDNLHRGRREHLADSWEQITFIEGDIRDRAALGGAMKDCEVVFHLAAQSNVIGAVQDIEYSFSSNVVGTFNVLQIAREHGARRVVFTSSREVYGEPKDLPVPEAAPLNPKNAYGASKAAGELYCRVFAAYGLETVILRLANVYGTRDRDRVIPIFLENALTGEPLTLYGGKQVLDLVWIDVVVDALLKTACGDLIKEPANVGSGSGIAITELAQRVLQVTRSSSQISFAPGRDVEVSHFVADMSKAGLLLGLHPPGDSCAHLSDVAEWMRSRYVSGD